MSSKRVVKEVGLLGLSETQFADVADALQRHLAERRVSFHTTETTFRVACHFAQWKARGDRRGGRPVSRELLQRFLKRHLPNCRCPGRPTCALVSARAALGNLAHVLLQQGRLESRRNAGEIDSELESFASHLLDVCGCAPSTVRQRHRMVGEFLRHLFSDGTFDRASISPEGVVQFVTSRAARYRPGSIGVLSTALRSYFRYLQLAGVADAFRLIDAVPTIARWRLGSVPAYLSEKEVRDLWASFDRSVARGRRDYAMTLLMSVLGLRVQEVALLRVGDVDWRVGSLHVPPTKTRRGRELPLPGAVGRAIARYLRTARPASSSRTMFLRLGVSEGQPVNASAVRASVRQAYKRAGLPAHYTGTHRLRHTAATRMVQGGASVKEVADLLGHAALDSTAVYAKVDLPRLRAVALPWPRRS